MEIGRLEFYATKPDRRGRFFGKIYPYSKTIRESLDGGLVFFHESCVPRTSALRTDRKLRGYQYITRLRGRVAYANPVYVAFDMPGNSTTRKGDAAASVVMLEEASPEDLPDFTLTENAGVRVALISSFPSVYTLSRIGREVIQFEDQLSQLKACWDSSCDTERIEFMRSLDSIDAEKALSRLMEIDERESRNLRSPPRTHQALAARPDAVLAPSVAVKLVPCMWVDELTAIMCDPDKRSTLMAFAKPPFRAYALTRFVEGGGLLEGNVADCFVAAIRQCTDAELTAKCLQSVLVSQPHLALRDDVSGLLTPTMWVNELLDLVQNPTERRLLLTNAQPTFCAFSIAMLAKRQRALDDDTVPFFIAAVRESTDRELVTECVRLVLSRQPDLVLIDDIAAMLSTDTWVDELLYLMRCLEHRHAFLKATSPEFHVYAISRFVEAGGILDRNDAIGFAAAIRACGNSSLASRTLKSVLAKQPHLALVADISAILTPNIWTDELLELMGSPEEMRHFLIHTQPAFRAYATSKYLRAGGQLGVSDVPSFLTTVCECGEANLASECMTALLARHPQIAFTSSVASMLTKDMWVDELLGLMVTPQGQMALLEQVRPDFRAYAVLKLVEADMDVDIGVLSLCPLRSCPFLLDQVQWSIDDESYAEAVGCWLQEARLSDSEGRRLIVSVGERIHATGNLLSPTMWAHIPVAMRIRLCIFWFNHFANLDEYAMRGGIVKTCYDAYKSKWLGYDQTLKAALLLLALPLSRNPMKAFLDANDALIGEIVRQFNECSAKTPRSFVLGDELQALLQRCASYPYVDDESVMGFCDGRWWKRESSIWCHVGLDRPEGGRCKCDCLCSPISADDEVRGPCPDLENQFMADLLANVNKEMGGNVVVGAWLDSRNRMDLVEYAYRVSGYVNKMVAALPHMVCRGCGVRLRLNYEYPRKDLYGEAVHQGLNLPALSATVCSCPNAGDGRMHDSNIYIHYCLNCHRIIDSRECRIRDDEGYYLCMYCGASRVYAPGTVCPSCGNTNLRTLNYYTGSMRKELNYLSVKPHAGEILVVCKVRGCNYDARRFRSQFEQW